MVTARIDAVWLHDGVLDCRDYKTGSPRYERVADDPAARLQVWLLARLADEMGVSVRLRYEHLVEGLEEDPEPFDPDADDIAQIQSDIGEVAAAIAVSEFRESVTSTFAAAVRSSAPARTPSLRSPRRTMTSLTTSCYGRLASPTRMLSP